jgi:hypothetical protein
MHDVPEFGFGFGSTFDAPREDQAAKAKAAAGLLASFPPGEVRTYLNTLWLQDPERWGALEGASDWLPHGS